MKMKSGFFIGILAFSLSILVQSCLPYKTYERNRESHCLFLNPRSLTVEQKCKDGDYENIVFLKVDVYYDTIKLVDGKPYSTYTLYEVNEPISFPYKLDSRVAENKGRVITIALRSNKREQRFGITIKPSDWSREIIPFTFYYNK